MASACVWVCMLRAHTHAHTKGWSGLVTEPQTCSSCHLGLAHDSVCVFVCVFVLCAAGRTDDSSCASLPTRAALLPSNTDQTAVARRRVKCTLKPLISLSFAILYLFFDQCIILLVNIYCQPSECFSQ